VELLVAECVVTVLPLVVVGALVSASDIFLVDLGAGFGPDPDVDFPIKFSSWIKRQIILAQF